MRINASLPLLVFAALAMSAGPSLAKKVNITNTKFKEGVVSYFRGKAENVVLGSYGEKKTPVGKGNYLAVEDDVPRVHLGKINIKKYGPIDIDWSKESDASVNVGGRYLTAGGTAGFSRKAAQSAKLKLMKFSIDEGQLKKLLNDHASAARKYLEKGNRGRIVSEVWIAIEAELANDIAKCGTVTGDATVKGVKITVDTKLCSKSKSTISIPENTTFAYLLHKVKKWNKGKTKIENMEDDQQGLN